MNNGRRFLKTICFLFLCMMAASCGPSPEELAATSAAETAAAASPTPLPTSTPTPTFTPTPTPTLTPTPLPDPDPKAMLKWREVGFPDGIIAIPPGVRGVEEGAYAFSLIINDGSIKEYYISGSFAFNDDLDDPSQLIYGYTVLLPSSKDREAFDDFNLNYMDLTLSSAVGVSISSVSDLSGSESIGDLSVGVTTQYDRQGELWQFSIVSFRVDDIGAWVFIRNDASISSPVNAVKVASVYADSIQRPVVSCKLTSVEPDTSNDVPTFIFDAEGFYPSEGRIISLTGNIIVGEETTKGGTYMLGMEGESADKDGKITDVISFPTMDQLASQGMIGAALPPGPNEFSLIIKGTSSGCEIEHIVTWSGELGLATTPEPSTQQTDPTSSTSHTFRDDFNNELDNGWEWLYEFVGGWNLNDRPGFLRIEVPLNAKQFLVRNAPEGNFEITTRVLVTPDQNFQQAGLIILHDDGHMLMFHRGYAFFPNVDCCIGNALYYDNIDFDLGLPGAGYGIDLLSPTKTDEMDEAYLRLTREGKTYTAYYSNDGENWTTVGKHEVDWVPVYVGIQTSGNQNSTPADADFDYFTLETFP